MNELQSWAASSPAFVLPEAWVDRVLSQMHLADEVERVGQERKKAEQRLRRLAQVDPDGHVADEEYGGRRSNWRRNCGRWSCPKPTQRLPLASYRRTCRPGGGRPTSESGAESS